LNPHGRGGAARFRWPPIKLLLLLEHYVDFKMWKPYDEHLGQTVTISYKLATNETWDELEPGQVSSLIEAGVMQARRQSDSDLDALDPSDSEDRLYYATMGLLGHNPAFVRLSDYVRAQPAYQRLKSLDQEFLPGVNTAVRKRHREAMASCDATGRSVAAWASCELRAKSLPTLPVPSLRRGW
jgi:hypothetical protein